MPFQFRRKYQNVTLRDHFPNTAINTSIKQNKSTECVWKHVFKRRENTVTIFPRDVLRNNKTDSNVTIQIQCLQYENVPRCVHSFIFKSGLLQTIYYEYNIFANFVNHQEHQQEAISTIIKHSTKRKLLTFEYLFHIYIHKINTNTKLNPLIFCIWMLIFTKEQFWC